MDIDAQIKQLNKEMGSPKFRATHGQWVPYAWVVRGLVEKGQQPGKAVEAVVLKAGLEPYDTAIGSLRAAYYTIRKKPWPEKMARKAAKHGAPAGASTDTEDDAAFQ